MAKRDNISLDSVDRKILHLLQQDASLTIKELAEKVHLSPTPCWKRIQRMEDNGVIRARVALLNADKVDAGITVFLAIKTDKHNAEWSQQFADVMSSFPEIVEIYRMSGEVDYLVRIVVPDIPAYDSLYKSIISKIDLTDMTSMFAMEQMKYTTALPVMGVD
ncbi:MAG: Lrp/AsnC family transcriptional regulator [Acidiferrobacterales bacterium]|nr:Lrp/AsnC family transcriptional regulator [Acidiferrobacterales bacterium]